MPSQIFTANGNFTVPTYTSLIVIIDGPGAGGSGDVPGANATGNNTFNTTLVAQPGQTNASVNFIPGDASGGDFNVGGGAFDGGTNGAGIPPGDGTGDGFTGGG
jgi:hypothetical protein